jgi:mono/diheme cytochrome c family protein
MMDFLVLLLHTLQKNIMKRKKQNQSKWSVQLPILPVILVIAVFLAACGNPTDTQTTPPAPRTPVPTDKVESPADTQAPPAAESDVSFSQDIFPILQKSCHQCHGSSRTDANLSLINYDQLMAGGNRGAAIKPGDADNSLLIKLVVTQSMPKVGSKLTPEQIQLITDWVNQGALDN